MLAIKQILAIAYKETRLWLQVPGNWLSILLVPFVFITILGSVFGGSTPLRFMPPTKIRATGADVIGIAENSPNLELEYSGWREADRRGLGERMAAVVAPDLAQRQDRGGRRHLAHH
jgi:hypothetical protein